MLMQDIRMLVIFFAVLCCTGCTVGEIINDSFYLKNDFTVQLLNEDWKVIRQIITDPLNPKEVTSRDKIAFAHKKSNGYIAATSYVLNEVEQARPLSVHADAAVASWRGMKLSEKQTKIDGVDAIEVVISSTRMVKWVYMKKGEKAYQLIYLNTPAYFDEYLAVFDKFVETFKIL